MYMYRLLSQESMMLQTSTHCVIRTARCWIYWWSYDVNFLFRPLLTWSEFASGYPINVYDGNMLLLAILRCVWCLLTCQMVLGMGIEILYLRVTLQKGVVEVGEDDDEWEPVEPITSPCDSIFRVLRVKCQKASLYRQPSASTCWGG
jgi:hypothetical protein